MANSGLIIIALMCLLGVTSSFKLCQCSDYGSLEACPTDCIWQNNQCKFASSNCSQITNEGDCAPTCYWNSVNQTCTTLPPCSQIRGDSFDCKVYGCVTSNQTFPDEIAACTSFTSCSNLKNEDTCDQAFQQSTNGANGVQGTYCIWNGTSPFNGNCHKISTCEQAGSSLQMCDSLPWCDFFDNLCQPANCKSKTTQYECENLEVFMDQCQWNVVNQTGFCQAKDCSMYKTNDTCGQVTNDLVCAWNGTACKNCFSYNDEQPNSAWILTSFIALGAFLLL